jgi:hypothetical protein
MNLLMFRIPEESRERLTIKLSGVAVGKWDYHDLTQLKLGAPASSGAATSTAADVRCLKYVTETPPICFTLRLSHTPPAG